MTYPLVYADPPWPYRDKANAGKRGACHKYPVMHLSEIATTLHQHAAKASVLFLWATWPTMADALHVAKLAGFHYRTCAFVWVKLTSTGKHHFGMGHWSRANSEPCLLFTRGKDYPRPLRRNIRQVVEAPIGEHSAKPAEVRKRIDDMMGRPRRIELFARERVRGWDAYGLEVDKRLEGYAGHG